MPGLDVDLQRDRTAVVELALARVLPCGTSPGAKTWPKLSGTSLWPSLAVLSIARLVRAPFSVAAAMPLLRSVPAALATPSSRTGMGLGGKPSARALALRNSRLVRIRRMDGQ
ncbi:hypothetical protein LP419_18790 [Massilia sp. H-1]|nr:hypothetical protein LP419_18790 [Massilia sp. H-1]